MGQSDEDPVVSGADEALQLVYDELRHVAAAKLASEHDSQTLQPTALVHEAYLRLTAGGRSSGWNGKSHFFAAAAEAMRRILIDRARARNRIKRGGKNRQVELSDDDGALTFTEDSLQDLDEAIEKLRDVDAIAASLVKLRCFAGLSITEAGNVLEISRANAYRHWDYARAWIHVEFYRDTDNG